MQDALLLAFAIRDATNHRSSPIEGLVPVAKTTVKTLPLAVCANVQFSSFPQHVQAAEISTQI
jgi:hypothetical protein